MDSVPQNLISGEVKAPSGWVPREDQLEVFRKIEAAYKSGKKIVAVQGPTGSGKSLVGMAVTQAFASAYYLVPLKSLQDQIEKDFTGYANCFKGKANYVCHEFFKPDNDTYKVNESPCQDKDQAEQRKFCKVNRICDYYNALDAASQGRVALMNFVLYLCWMRIAQESERAPFKKRTLHVIDEAHKIEESVRDFITVDLSADRIEKYLGVKGFPKEGAEKEAVIKFLGKVDTANKRELARLEEHYGKQLQSVGAEIGSDKINFHNSLADKLKIFFENQENYSFGFEERYNGTSRKNVKYIIVKPLFVGGFIRANVLGDFTLLLSATLPKKSVIAMGFAEEEIEYIEMPSRFPAENRLIKFRAVGRINKDNTERLIPKMVYELEKILDFHKDSKGLIHAPSYRVAELLAEAMKSSPHAHRFLFQDRNPGSAKMIMQAHVESPSPTVLISPGFKEGVDLKGDLSRFQVVVKTPYPNLGDPAVKELSARDHSWYISRTIVDLLQMVGRSIRSETDYAATYCLDDNTRILIKDYRPWFPQYFIDSVRWVG